MRGTTERAEVGDIVSVVDVGASADVVGDADFLFAVTCSEAARGEDLAKTRLEPLSSLLSLHFLNVCPVRSQMMHYKGDMPVVPDQKGCGFSYGVTKWV